MAMIALNQRIVCPSTFNAGIYAGRGRRAVVTVRAVSAPEAPAASPAPADTTPVSTSAPAGERAFRDGTSRRTQPGRASTGAARRPRGGSQGQQQQQQAERAPTSARRSTARAEGKERWPEVAFLDDDAGEVEYTARAMFKRHMASAEAVGNVIVRSLGRGGAAGAVRFLTALRREGQAAQPPVDVRVRVLKQEPIRGGFGAPLLMFVERVAAGTDQLPEVPPPAPAAAASSSSEPTTAPSGPLQATLKVSRSGNPERLVRALSKVVGGLQPGQFVAVNMVGPATLLLGLRALVSARTDMGIRGRDVYFVPTITSQPLLASSATSAPAAAGAPAAEQPAAAAEASTPVPAPAAAAAPEPQMVEVVRLFVGRSASARPPRAEPAAAPAPAPTASETPQASSSAGEEQAPAAPAAQPQEQVTVPLSELESLRSALSTMMQQQQQLEALLKDRQQRQQQQQ